ncbi:uncharacterized protein CC84DRAFT_1159336 [Paraphaeosphaeria sporulosa]|uniref:Uncharacterized protein n=1 Tax=Paraphaeosphaeria sporulosa TaxID=1460663 RepID=A0A177CWK5_9PLEO|nr:uncharacterized protein CC84DRAFT_1159336 [Paraphaeosphaeria sporulosa]OAG11925.1 hypothetical protein CC84DRAFT_1159336 [Paraphaeosphaeria sporulosa]
MYYIMRWSQVQPCIWSRRGQTRTSYNRNRFEMMLEAPGNSRNTSRYGLLFHLIICAVRKIRYRCECAMDGVSATIARVRAFRSLDVSNTSASLALHQQHHPVHVNSSTMHYSAHNIRVLSIDLPPLGICASETPSIYRTHIVADDDAWKGMQSATAS